jgi:hypothetical protein
MEKDKLKTMRLVFIFLLLPFLGLTQSRIVVNAGTSGSSGSGGISQEQLDDSTAAIRAAIPSSVSGSVPPQRSQVVVDIQYSQSPIVFQSDNWIYQTYNIAPTHTVFGLNYIKRSADNISWTDAEVITVPGFDSICGLTFGTVGERILMSFHRLWPVYSERELHGSADYSKVLFAVSDDLGSTWVLKDSIDATGLPAGYYNFFCYGDIENVKGNTSIMPYYAWSVTGDTTYAFCFGTTDAGENWAFKSEILSGRFSFTFPNASRVNETWIEKVTEGSTAANTTLMAFTRTEKYFGYHYETISTDGGATWVSLAVTDGVWFSEFNATSGPNTFPVSAYNDGTYINVVYGYRGNSATGVASNVRLIKIPLATYDDPTTYTKPRILYSSLNFKAQHQDFGYNYEYEANGQWFTTFYDISPQHKSGASINSVRARIVTIPLDGNNYLDISNDADQTITTATETTVQTPDVRLDSEGSYNTDSTKIYFPYDGWYTINARVTFDANASGTYRRATLWMIDHGDEYGTAPTSMGGKYMITQKSITPSANAEFNRIELSGQIYAYAGMELRLTVQHDVGSNLNILNSVQNNRATIYFKKSD